MANKMADKKKNASQGQAAEPKSKVQDGEKEQSKNVKAQARGRNERREQQSKPSQRDSKKNPSFIAGLRNNSVIRFLFEAYYELRHKVTWPTFEQARNMTLVVILLSLAIGILLGLADLGLFQLFRLVSGK